MYGLLYGYDFSELFGNIPYIEISNQQNSIKEGETVDFKVKLSKASIGTKQVIVKSDNPAISINGNPSVTLTFTPQNSREEQILSVKAEVDENLVSEETNISFDSNWHSRIQLIVTNKDKDSQSILVSAYPENPSFERGSSISYKVKLAKQPNQNISIQPVSNNIDLLQYSAEPLIFTPENYNIEQNIDISILEKMDYLSKDLSIEFKSNILSVIKTFSVIPNLEYIDISAGQGVKSGYTPSIAIDKIHSKVLVSVFNWANDYKLGLFRCNLTTVDGSDCQHIDISAGQGSNSLRYPAMAIDEKNQKLLVVATNKSNLSKLSMVRCNLTTVDGSDCQYIDISAGQPESSGMTPVIDIDKANGKFLVATQNITNGYKLSLYRCNLNTVDGSDCQHIDISAGQGNNSG
ncbi:MAG: hypothetical protein H7A25_10005 [Leptospiraceae bacterium]|nr:hypothetical protein [Leptospiraceae bacterium]MCP5500224.1 hypothetical protein [Leptospiraceae bacterium]